MNDIVDIDVKINSSIVRCMNDIVDIDVRIDRSGGNGKWRIWLFSRFLL